MDEIRVFKTMEIRRIKNADEFNTVNGIRYEVFVKEQNVPVELEHDEHDKDSIHVIALSDDCAVGCGRVYIHNSEAKIGRVAVLKEYRRTGVGSAICNELIKIAEKLKAKRVILNSQISAVDFYKKIGFTQEGDAFSEAGIEHIFMYKDL